MGRAYMKESHCSLPRMVPFYGINIDDATAAVFAVAERYSEHIYYIDEHFML